MIKKILPLFNKPKASYEDLPHLWQQQIVKILKEDSELTESRRAILEDLFEALRIGLYDPNGVDILKYKLTEYFND